MKIHPENIKKIKEGFVGQQMIVLPPDILNRVSESPLILDFYLTAIGFYPHAAYHDRKRTQGSKEYILLYCVEGEGELIIGQQVIKIEPNQYVIIPPNLLHHYKSSESKPWSIYWCHFKGHKASSLYDFYAENSKPKNRRIPFNEGQTKNFKNVIEILDSSFEQSYLELANITFYFFICSLVYQSEVSSQVQERNVASKSIEFMKANLGKTLMIDDLAKNENLSVSRYSEIFKAKTGHPPINYYIKLKIQKSCQFLYFTTMTIKEICVKVGFADPYYFSRIFKKIMGISPSKYRQSYK